MALILCPSCGAQISDKSATCPRCGASVTEGTSTPKPMAIPIAQAEKEAVMEYIFPCEATKQEFHQCCMMQLMKSAEADIFEKIENMKVRQQYLWIREFRSGDEYDFYPMSEYGEQLFMAMEGSEIMRGQIMERHFPIKRRVEMSKVQMSNRDQTIKEFTPQQTTERYMSKLSSIGLPPTANYYCIPIFEESFDYQGKSYIFQGLGNKSISKYWWNGLPENPLLATGPKYIQARPLYLTNVILGILIALSGGLLLFSQVGFWLSVLIVLITAGVCFAIGALLISPYTSLLNRADRQICKRINTRRRKDYLANITQIQERKVNDARILLGLNLTYKLPKCPIPKDKL